MSSLAAAESTWSTREAATIAGASYRQMDYWRRQGWISGMDACGPGSGSSVRWSAEQVDAACRLAEASRALSGGLVGVAEALARRDLAEAV